MIKNIIFDMGQVLIRFDPDYFVERTGISNEEDKKILNREVYKSIEWAKMDRGTLTVEEGCQIIKQRVPDHLKSTVEQLTCHWVRPILPIAGAKELIKELKQKGYNIYLLSNAALNQKDYWPKVPGHEYFDGTVISSDILLVKPQLEIYEYTLNKFSLKAEECVFIDDSIANVEAAVYSGIEGIVFHGDYEEVREKLRGLGVLV